MESIIKEGYERPLLSWVREKVGEGVELLKRERAYNEIDTAIKYINGEQFPMRSRAISRLTDNRLRKGVLEMVSALTDVRPIWNYETENPQYKEQAIILNKLARAWWKNAKVDRKLQSALTLSAAGGSGYLGLTWNPSLPGGGELEVISYDPRDVLPIGPTFSDSIQDWQGVILFQRLPVENVQRMFPSKKHLIAGNRVSWVRPEFKDGGRLYNLSTVMWDVISRGAERRGEMIAQNVDLIRVYYKDDTIHTGDEPKWMGDPDAPWGYMVYPIGWPLPSGGVATAEDARLYPRGRLIICTPDCILRDIPNPNWHGQFPLIRFTLDPLPWSILGASVVGDLVPLQNALNEGLRGLEDGMAQWMRRGVVADKTALSPKSLEALDTRKAGLKALITPTGGEAFKVIDGPKFPDFYMAMIQYYKDEIDDVLGTKNLAQTMAASKRVPTTDKIEEAEDAMSPMLQLRSRSVEVSLSELAEMLKVCFFQYYKTRRRVQILGPDGVTLEDMDFDPGSMVPSDEEESDAATRAVNHHKNFHFNIAPNSFLSVSHSTHRMMVLQLFRAQGIDIYSVWDALDMGNAGPTPGETIPERMAEARRQGLQAGPPPELVQAQIEAAIVAAKMQTIQAMAMMGMPVPGAGAPGPPGAPPPGGQVRNSGVGPEGGRPPSGNQPPRMVQKDGGARTVISESGP